MSNNVKVQEKEDILLTVVDLGNLNIKYTKDGVNSQLFSSMISYDIESYEEGFQRIEYNNRVVYIGKGQLSREFSKVKRDYIEQLLYAICKCHKDKNNINTNLCLMLPAIQMKNNKTMNDNLKGKEFKFKFNGEDRIIKINDVLIIPEGYATYFSLNDEEKNKDVCIIDCGSRTINICCMSNKKIEKLHTCTIGSFDLYREIKNEINVDGRESTEEDIIRMIKSDIIKVSKEKYENFFKSGILNSIKGYVDIRNYYTIFTGGTIKMLNEQLNLSSEYKIHDDPLNSNLIGAYKAAKNIWRN